MSDNEYNHELFSLEHQIKEELQLMESNLDALSDEDYGSRDLFTEYQLKFRFIHDLFDRASEYIRELVLDQENPQLYALLECKQNIQQHYGLYRYLQNRFQRQFGRDAQEHEEELERVQEPEPVVSEEEDEEEQEAVVSDEQSREALEAARLAAEEEAALEEEKAAKKRKLEKQRREKLLKSRKEAEEQAAKEALFRDRQNEKDRFLAAAAELYQRQMEQRRQEEQREKRQADQNKSASERQYTEYHRPEDPAKSPERADSPYSGPEYPHATVSQDNSRIQAERERRQREEYQCQDSATQHYHTESRSSSSAEYKHATPVGSQMPDSNTKPPDIPERVYRYEHPDSRPDSTSSYAQNSFLPDHRYPNTTESQRPAYEQQPVADVPRPNNQYPSDRHPEQPHPAPYPFQDTENSSRTSATRQGSAPYPFTRNEPPAGYDPNRRQYGPDPAHTEIIRRYPDGPVTSGNAPATPCYQPDHVPSQAPPVAPPPYQTRHYEAERPGYSKAPDAPGHNNVFTPEPLLNSVNRDSVAQPYQSRQYESSRFVEEQRREHTFQPVAPHGSSHPDARQSTPSGQSSLNKNPAAQSVVSRPSGHENPNSSTAQPTYHQSGPDHREEFVRYDAPHSRSDSPYNAVQHHRDVAEHREISNQKTQGPVGSVPESRAAYSHHEPQPAHPEGSHVYRPDMTHKREQDPNSNTGPLPQGYTEHHHRESPVRHEDSQAKSPFPYTHNQVHQDTPNQKQDSSARAPYTVDPKHVGTQPELFSIGREAAHVHRQDSQHNRETGPGNRTVPLQHNHDGLHQQVPPAQHNVPQGKPGYPQNGFQPRHENSGHSITVHPRHDDFSRKSSTDIKGTSTHHAAQFNQQNEPKRQGQDPGAQTGGTPRNHHERYRQENLRPNPRPNPKDTDNVRPNEVKPKDGSPKPDEKKRPKTFYHFVPGGIAETQLRRQALTALSAEHAAASSDNHQILSAIKAASPTPGKPHMISPAYVTQMRFNLDRAKIAYQESQGTEEAKQAAHRYMTQRSAYMKLRGEIKQGNIQVERPKVMATKAATRQEKAANNSSVLYHFTPSGVQGQVIENAVLTGTTYELRHRGKRPAFHYTRANPLVVNPAYESALKARVNRASIALNHAVAASHVRGRTVRVNPAINDEVTVATAAYIGFLRAKQGGQVVVSAQSDCRTPDYDVWSQQYCLSRRGRSNVNHVKGETAQAKGANPNKVTKESVEEVTANILGKSVKLKRHNAVAHYMKMAGYRIDGYTSMALSRASRKFYYMLQNGDEDAPESIRTFEQGRYYLMTAVGVRSAIKNFHVVNSKGAAKQAGKGEVRRYSKYYFQDPKALSHQIHQNIKSNRLLKKEIKDLIKQGSSLTPEQRKELLSKMKNLAKSSHETTKAVAFRDLQRKNANLVKASVDLENKRKVITSRAKIDETIDTIRHKQEKKMAKKFGKLMTVTDKSLARQIQQMKTQGRDLKEQIKLLQAKGSLLTTSERKQLMKLMKKHQALMAELKRYTGLRDARKNLKAMLAPYMDMRKRIIKNTNAWSNGGYALYGLLSRGFRQSGDVGLMGIAKVGEIATNRYVRILVKKTIKLSYRTTKWLSDKTGLTKAAKKVGRATAKSIVNSAPAKTIQSGVSITKSTIKTAIDTTKTAAVRMTPSFVKTGVAKGAKGKMLFKNFAQRTQKRMAESTLGRGVSAIYRNVSKFTSAITRGLSILKGFLVKGALFLLGAIVIFGLIIGIVEVIASAASSIIMGTDEEDGKIDLTPYVEIINDLEDEFDTSIKLLETYGSYDNVYINYVTDTMDNTKEMLSMLAVRTNQDLSKSNPLVKQYLTSLYHDSHTYVTSEDEYECSGCDTYIEEVDVIDPETGQVVLDAQSGRPVKEEIEVEYCPGHVDLFIDISILGFDAIFGADSMGNLLTGDAVAGGLIGNATITYYCIEPYPHICNDGTADTTATGTKPTPGRTIAVDPSRIPLGSHVIIDGHEYIAEDTGGAIDSLDIDIVVATHAEALRKGTRKNVPVYWAVRDGEGIKDTGKWNGWTKDNIDWCKMIYQQDWSDLYTGLGVEGFAPALDDKELQAVIDGLPANLSETRRNIIQSGLSGIGRIRYNWGGKPTGPGLSGLPATGLDCSGFVSWAYMTAGVPRQNWYGGGTGAINSSSSMKQISKSQLKPGDLGFKHVGGSASSSNANHVGIYVGKNSSGKDVWLHCASGSGATINTYGGFTVYFRSTAFN